MSSKKQRKLRRRSGPDERGMRKKTVMALILFSGVLIIWFGTSKLDIGTKSGGNDGNGGGIVPIEGDSLAEDQDSRHGFPICDMRFSDLIPCHEINVLPQLISESNWKLMGQYERHCPPLARRHRCLVPPPVGYKIPIKWPASRYTVWMANVPASTHLLKKKSNWPWFAPNRDKISFPCGADGGDDIEAYIIILAKKLGFPMNRINGGGRIRTALDMTCGVACFGAQLFDQNIISISLSHARDAQLALERGYPAMIGVLARKRLPYPSRSFDLAHCYRCGIDWLQRDGILLLELDRVLSLGGYFVYSPPEALASDTESLKMRDSMHDLLTRMCWSVAASSDQTVVWSKPMSNDCYFEREPGTKPLLCSSTDELDETWNISIKACITPYSAKMHRIRGSGLHIWPLRLISPPPRLEEIGCSASEFQADTGIWRARVNEYLDRMKRLAKSNTFRNVMDMNSNLGGFAAALGGWVMNVAPVHVSSRLKIVYDRGLIGVVHDWCESFSTHPRSYDLLHAWMVFSEIEQRGCNKEDLLIEMDRMLRPKGIVIIRDSPEIIRYVRRYLSSLFWNDWLTEFSPTADALSIANETVLVVRKKLWVVPAAGNL